METKKTAIPVKTRLKQYVASLGISEREFCRVVGVSSGYIESIKQSISPKVMQAITIHYPLLNPTWLLLGQGNMTKGGDASGVSSSGDEPLPSEMLVELLAEARAINERLSGVVVSQQETISELVDTLKKKLGAED